MCLRRVIQPKKESLCPGVSMVKESFQPKKRNECPKESMVSRRSNQPKKGNTCLKGSIVSKGSIQPKKRNPLKGKGGAKRDRIMTARQMRTSALCPKRNFWKN